MASRLVPFALVEGLRSEVEQGPPGACGRAYSPLFGCAYCCTGKLLAFVLAAASLVGLVGGGTVHLGTLVGLVPESPFWYLYSGL